MATLTQLPDPVDLSFVAGDTFRIRVRVIDPTTATALEINPVPGSPGEPGEYGFVAEIARTPDRAIVAQFAISPDIDTPTSAVILSLSPAETAALPGMGDGEKFEGIWDLEVTFPNTDVRTVATGTVTCVLDVSNKAPDKAVVANAGTPGTWSPSGGTKPATVAALQAAGITANPATAWPSGSYVQTATAGAPGEANWNGTAWVAGRRP